MYLVWQDDNPKRPVAEKIRQACEAYREKTGRDATAVLVAEGEDVAGVDASEFLVMTGASQGLPVQKSTFYVGQA